ncbi:MAG TPA: hypothetical protein VHO46_00995 [Bacteroidales bacterium]|nr:hypothetical protein [Bacteroidales bacterium]
MKRMKSVLVRSLLTVMLVVGLTAASCNQRSGEVKVKEDKQGNEDVRIKQRQNTDSVDVKRDQTIERNSDGDSKIKEDSRIETDRSSGQGSSEGKK